MDRTGEGYIGRYTSAKGRLQGGCKVAEEGVNLSSGRRTQISGLRELGNHNSKTWKAKAQRAPLGIGLTGAKRKQICMYVQRSPKAQKEKKSFESRSPR